MKYLLIIQLFIACTKGEIEEFQKLDQILEIVDEEIIDRKDLNLYGNVRSFIEYEIPIKDADSNTMINMRGIPTYKYLSADTLISNIRAKSLINSYSIHFDNGGKAIREIQWYRSESQSDTRNEFSYKFNEKGQLIKKEHFLVTGHDKIGDLLEEITFTYNNSGRLINSCSKKYVGKKTIKSCMDIYLKEFEIVVAGEKVDFKSGDTIEIFSRSISPNGVIFNSNDGIRRIYNNLGELIKTINYDSVGNEDKVVSSYSYDNEGNLIQETEYDNNGRIWAFTNYSYNEGILELIAKNELGSWIYEYFNENGELIKTQKIDKYNDTLIGYNEVNYFYDSLNNQISMRFLNIDRRRIEKMEIINTEYIYDKAGNWIERRFFVNDSLNNIRRREISYYQNS